MQITTKNPTCRNCDSQGWVCENHLDHPWGGTSVSDAACGCGAGAPCPVCAPQLQNDRIFIHEIAAIAPGGKPVGPYGDLGGYISDNYGDVIHAAENAAEWNIADKARQYLAKARGEA